MVRELDEEVCTTVDTHLGERLTHVVDPGGQAGGLAIAVWIVTFYGGEVMNRSLAERPGLRLAHVRLPALLDGHPI